MNDILFFSEILQIPHYRLKVTLKSRHIQGFYTPTGV